MGFLEFIITYKIPLIFYAVVIALIYTFRKKLDWQAKGIGLYKTKVGVKLMQKIADKHAEFIKWLGYIGIGVGFSGMAFIVWTLIKGIWDLVFNPAAPAVIAPVIPGFNIPGVGITVPLITGWLALFVVVLIHEFSHGVVSKAHKIPVKSSGLLVFGPILGAFVEPEEKKLKASSDVVQYSVYAAGPFSNILSAFIFTFILGIIIAPIILGMTVPAGIELTSVTPDLPAAIAGLEQGAIITAVNGIDIIDSESFLTELETLRPDEQLNLTDDNNNNFLLTSIKNPDNPAKGLIGINLASHRIPKLQSLWYLGLLNILNWLKDFIKWIVILSLGIGLANLLPLGPVDGGRMLQVLLLKTHGKKGDYYWKKTSLITLAVIIILLLIPLVKGLF